MRHTLLIVTFFVSVLLAYNIPQFAEAQTSAGCDEAICHVKITKDGFVPKRLIVKVGTTIVWTNTDDRGHTVTSGSPGEVTAPLKSVLLEKGDTYEFTFHLAGLFQGSYKYFDQVIKHKRGEIIVEPELVKTAEIPKRNTTKIDFTDPQSGVKKVSLSNGSIKSMEIDPGSLSLIITLENVEVRTAIEITLDRNLIDATSNGKDDRFVVLFKEGEGFFDEISSTPTERTLRIVVPSKTMHIEILGTQVIPEFPVTVMAVMGVTITTAIAVSRFQK